MADRVTAKALDFSNVKDRGPINPVQQTEGDYKANVKQVLDIEMGDQKRPAWMFVIEVGKGTYPLRCGFNENELWKIRNLFVACGIAVPKKRVKVDPTKVVGRDLGVTLEDHEYEGRTSSQIAATFPVSELDGQDDEPIDDEDEEAEEAEDEDEDEDEAPPPPKKARKAKPAPVEEEEEDEDEDELEALDIEDL